MNCLTGFVKRRAKEYTNACTTLKCIHTLFSKSLVWQDAFFEPVQLRYRRILKNFNAIIHTTIIYKHELASSRHTFHKTESRGLF